MTCHFYRAAGSVLRQGSQRCRGQVLHLACGFEGQHVHVHLTLGPALVGRPRELPVRLEEGLAHAASDRSCFWHSSFFFGCVSRGCKAAAVWFLLCRHLLLLADDDDVLLWLCF